MSGAASVDGSSLGTRASALVLAVNTLSQRPRESLAGLGLLVLGLPAYFYWKKSGRARTTS